MTPAPRWGNFSLRTKILIVVSVPLVPLIVSATMFAANLQRARDAQYWVNHTLEVKAQTAIVLGDLLDAETGVRGFLLTHGAPARDEDRRAVGEYADSLRHLSELVVDNPSQLERLRTVSTLRPTLSLQVLQKYGETAGLQAPPPIDLLADSRRTMEAARRELEAMHAAEDRLLEERAAAAVRADRQLLWITVVGAAVGLVGGLAAAVALTGDIVARIDRVRQNARRLSRGEPLLPLPQSGDEVGQLSKRLGETAILLTNQVQALESARAELDGFFSMSLDMLCIAGANGRFLRVNPAWESTLGWTSEELTAVPYLDFVHPDDMQAAVEAGEKLSQGTVAVSFETRYRCKDGSYRWLSWKATPVPSRGVIYATARDISERKRVVRELEAHADALAAANEELEAFSYSVSHDLRAPLRHVTGFASMLERQPGSQLDADGRRYVRTIADAARNMGRLIDDLLSFSRMARVSLTKRPVDLDEVVREVQRETMADVTDRQIEWALDKLPTVLADRSLLQLVFANLLANAVKYTATRPEARIHVGLSDDSDEETVVFVRDNGVGFDMLYAHKLFGVFQRLHTAREFEGTGIGLANVRRIIHRHGGRTWAEGVVDGGATFFVSLPKSGIA